MSENDPRFGQTPPQGGYAGPQAPPTPGYGGVQAGSGEQGSGYGGPQASYGGPQTETPDTGYAGPPASYGGTEAPDQGYAGPPAAGAPVAAEPPPAAAQPPVQEEQPPPEQTMTSEDVADSIDLPPFQLESEDGKASIDDFLRYIVEVNASDLHVKSGSPPTIRHSGLLMPLDYPMVLPDEANALADELMGEKERADIEEWGEADFAYSLAGVGRFRVNVHKQRGSLGVAARLILPGAPDFADLGLPPAVADLSKEHRGLLLVTGPTSSGKTTTCGAIIKLINTTRRCHIVTIEDPIEILHKDQMAVVTQREVGADTTGFHRALRAAMRQDPDVIFVGELRDIETTSAALQAAETGHLVIATMHTTDVAETVNRVIDFFPAHQQKQIRVALASNLAGVISQRLLPRIGGGRAPAIEVMINNGRIADCMIDSEKTHLIHEIVEQSSYYGMQTFDQALIKLYQSGVVTLDDAKSAANSPHDFELALQKAGII